MLLIRNSSNLQHVRSEHWPSFAYFFADALAGSGLEILLTYPLLERSHQRDQRVGGGSMGVRVGDTLTKYPKSQINRDAPP